MLNTSATSIPHFPSSTLRGNGGGAGSWGVRRGGEIGSHGGFGLAVELVIGVREVDRMDR